MTSGEKRITKKLESNLFNDYLFPVIQGYTRFPKKNLKGGMQRERIASSPMELDQSAPQCSITYRSRNRRFTVSVC